MGIKYRRVITIGKYLIDKFKGKYRLKTPYNQCNQFPRELNGNFGDNDVYIDCAKNVKIFHYGKNILEVYIPSIQYGRSIMRNIYRDYINKNNTKTHVTTNTIERQGKTVEITKESIEIIDTDLFKEELKSGIIFSVLESDSEVMFRFNANNMDKLEKYFKPKTSGASMSPFSTRNLPKTQYDIPEEDLIEYKTITEKLGKERILEITHTTNRYIKTLDDNIREDMKLKGLKGKEYLHSIGLWKEYTDYLRKELG